MKLHFDRFGKAGTGEIAPSDFIVISGPNNSGKTYVSYATYAFYKYFAEFFRFPETDKIVKELRTTGSSQIGLEAIRAEMAKHLNAAAETFKSGLEGFFKAPDNFFEKTNFKFIPTDEDNAQVMQFEGKSGISRNLVVEFEYSADTDTMSVVVTDDEGSSTPTGVLRRIVDRLIVNCIFPDVVTSTFIVTSERTGVSLFYKELDINRNAIFEHISTSKSIDPAELISAMSSRYARPIQDNIDVIRDYGDISKKKSFLRSSKAERSQFKYVFEALSELLGGSFSEKDDRLYFSPKEKGASRKKSILPIYMTSSSVKSLLLLDIYINHLAEEGGLLVVDEPELNLHPDNQVKIARLLVRLVNAGVRVLITTHSDYIIREINNLVSLTTMPESGRKTLMKRYGYTENDLIAPERLAAYSTNANAEFKNLSVTNEGIDAEVFDAIINRESVKAQDIYLSR